MLISVLIYYRPEGKLRFQSLDLKGNLHKWFYLYINMAASSEKSVCFTWDHLFKNHIIQFVQLVQLHEHHRTSVIISILPAPATCAGLLCHFLMVNAQTARLSRLNAPSVCGTSAVCLGSIKLCQVWCFSRGFTMEDKVVHADFQGAKRAPKQKWRADWLIEIIFI
jgi:hypothetical protein